MLRKPFLFITTIFVVIAIVLFFVFGSNKLGKFFSAKPNSPTDQAKEIILPDKTRVLIFCLHDISKRGRYAISEEELVGLLNQLRGKFIVLSLRDWYKGYLQGKVFAKPPVVLTFDDGYPAHLKFVVPQLRKYNFGATFFIYTKLNKDKSPFYKKLAALEPQFEIGGHSYSHADLKTMSQEDRKEFYHELYLSRKKLEYLTGKKVKSFAWPFGYYNQEVVALAKHAGYVLQVSTDGVVARMTQDTALLPRITVQQPSPLLQTEKILTRYEKNFYADKKALANSARNQRPLPR